MRFDLADDIQLAEERGRSTAYLGWVLAKHAVYDEHADLRTAFEARGGHGYLTKAAVNVLTTDATPYELHVLEDAFIAAVARSSMLADLERAGALVVPAGATAPM